MKINTKNMTIEMTKKEAKNAHIYGTYEYNALREMKKDYPGYREEVRKTKRKDNFKGLTYERMKAYILKHDSEDGCIMKTFLEYAYGKSDGDEIIDPAYYGETKKWFLMQFPEFKTFRSYEKVETAVASKLQIVQMTRKAVNE